ncbi:hypothetical protein IEO21_10425 [Rhodonia placenta]|uniref:Uncharacterized protein n=1 Tax=Rhodonia placenta TaxID=104341 RepID=A0A8H7NSH7_9APHY|nr:hypothetical protein IEO21_10425 [Postia placenta]
MLLRIGGEDEYEIMENIIYHRLEGCGGVGEAKEHYQGFVQSPVGHEGRLPLVTGFDPDVVVFPLNVKLCKERGAVELIYHLGNQRQGVAIFNCDRIQPAVILYGSKCSFLLFDEEKGGRNGRL